LFFYNQVFFAPTYWNPVFPQLLRKATAVGQQFTSLTKKTFTMTSISIKSYSGISKSEHADDVCPATPSSPSKTFQMSPNKSPNKASKHDKELKVLTDMVEDLTLKIKKRDKQVWQMQEKADKLNEVTLRLEITNKSIADAATENQTLSRRVLNLEANIKTQYVEESDRWNNVAKEPSTHTERIDEVEFRQAGPQFTDDLENLGGATTSRPANDTQEHIHFLNQQVKVLEAASVIQAVTGLYCGRAKKLFVSEADLAIQDAASLSERMSTDKLIDEAELVIKDVTGLYCGRAKRLFAAEADLAIQDTASLSERMSTDKLIDEAELVIKDVTGSNNGRAKRLFVSEADLAIQDAASLGEQMSTEKLIDEAELVIKDVTGSNSGHAKRLFVSEDAKKLFVSKTDSAIKDVASLSERMSTEKLIDEPELVVEDAAGSYSGCTKKLFVSEALASSSERTSSEKLIDEEEFRQLEIQRTFAVLKASEMSVILAESRAESDELRDQIASITALLRQQQNFGLSLVPESPVSLGLPQGKSRNISNFWKSPKTPGRPPWL
jgi:hypothetical protein